MELQQLKYFKTVAEVGKISAAAEDLFISPPALSNAIARLEKELGMPLFRRTNNSIQLNRQGEIFLRYVNQVFSTLECARVELRHSVVPHGQHVNVATLSSNTWIDLVAAFSQGFPHITLACTSLRMAQFAAAGLPHSFGFLLADMDRGLVDHTGELVGLPLFEDQLLLMVHPDHIFAREGFARAEDLLEQKLFLPMPDYPMYERVVQLFAGLGTELPMGNSQTALVNRKMVADNVGVSFTTRHCARTLPEGLRYVPIRGMEQTWRVGLYRRRHRLLTAEEQEFLQFVERLYAGRLEA